MRQLFILMLRPARSIIPWRPLCGRSGEVVVINGVNEADTRARTLADGGSMSVMVCPLEVPDDRCEQVRARLSDGRYYVPTIE